MNQEARHLSPELQREYLQLIQDIYDVSTQLATRTYIWGGMVVDILCGKFLREHHDIDGFTLGLQSIATEMAALFSQRGYAVSYSSEYGMMKVKKGQVHASFNPLEVDGDTAIWRHIGEQGAIYFPEKWLDKMTRDFCGVRVYTSGIRFEYAIKTNPHLLNPEWRMRGKDHVAVKFLSAEVDRIAVDEACFLSKIWSYSPYWVEKGYPEYEKCITPA